MIIPIDLCKFVFIIIFSMLLRRCNKQRNDAQAYHSQQSTKWGKTLRMYLEALSKLKFIHLLEKCTIKKNGSLQDCPRVLRESTHTMPFVEEKIALRHHGKNVSNVGTVSIIPTIDFYYFYTGMNKRKDWLFSSMGSMIHNPRQSAQNNAPNQCL